MAQQRLRDYQSPLGSFLHNIINLGIHAPGRFAGFDSLIVAGQLQFNLAHNASGVNTLDVAGNPYGPLGIVMSNQGEILVEDAPIAGLLIDTNAGNNNYRTDYVVLNHQYIQLANPAAANYSVVKGSLASNTPPLLSAFQTLIGVIIMPPQAPSISTTGVSYTKVRCPDSGDSKDARLDTFNQYKTVNIGNVDPGNYSAPALVDSLGNNCWDLGNLGNTFALFPSVLTDVDLIRINSVPNQDGFEINILINQFVRIKQNMPVGADSLSNGFYPLVFSDRLINGTKNQNNVTRNFIQPIASQNAIWILSLVKFNGLWYLKSIDGPGFNPGGFLKGMCVEVHMDITEAPNHFDTTGFGINDWLGWQLNNGNLNTVDKRGRVSIGAINIPNVKAAAFSAALTPPGKNTLSFKDTGGEPTHKIDKTELPASGLKIKTDPNNSGPDGFYVYDEGGGSSLSLKGDSDNTLSAGFVQTENMGAGAPMNICQPYVAVMWATKL